MAAKRSRPSRAGIKRPPPRSYNNPRRSQAGRIKLRQMHAYIREHRHKYPDLSWVQLLKILAPQWKKSCDDAKEKEAQAQAEKEKQAQAEKDAEKEKDAENGHGVEDAINEDSDEDAPYSA